MRKNKDNNNNNNNIKNKEKTNLHQWSEMQMIQY